MAKAEREHCVGGTRVQQWEASGGTAPVTGRRRQKSAGRRADHGSLTTCRQALGGRDIGEEKRESAGTGRERQEGRPRGSWLDFQLLSGRRSQESGWPRRPAPVAGRLEAPYSVLVARSKTTSPDVHSSWRLSPSTRWLPSVCPFR